VSEVVLKDRIHMASEGMFIVMLTVSRQTGRLLTSPDIISRGFIYLRDSEELMNTIRSYLKQKVARGFANRKGDLEGLKKELKDEITHILYDQTRRTPIVIPVVNEINTTPTGQIRPEQADAAAPAVRPFRSGPVPRPQREAEPALPIEEPTIAPREPRDF
jgi:ribonuclease J